MNRPLPHGMSPQAVELHAWLGEELAEAIQAIGKILRHGPDSRWPMDGSNPTNRQDLEKELGHVQHVTDRMVAAGLLSREAMSTSSAEKASAAIPYLHCQMN